VQGQNYLGIYISRDTATVVCLAEEGSQVKVAGCFTVAVEQQQESNLQGIANLIAQKCAERGLKFAETSVALDCAMFMQHSIHSEFGDIRKITQTIRFDTEEALSTDITNVAIAFKVDSTDANGSKLTVFSAEKQTLSDVLGALQSSNLDPVAVEPDVNCLARFLCRNAALAEDTHPLFALMSGRNGYFLVPLSSWQKEKSVPPMNMRTFLLRAAKDKMELLSRQVPVTAALLGAKELVNRLEVFDSAGSIDPGRIREKTGLEAEILDLAGPAGVTPQELVDCPDTVDFAIAFGAALSHLEKPQSMNFRNDFMPYQGRKMRLQKTVKFLSAAIVIVLIALGTYGFINVLQVSKYRSRLREKFEKEYSAVMFGQKMPGRFKQAGDNLRTAFRRTKEIEEGRLGAGGEEAIAAKLTGVLQALNKCAASTDLSIESVTITGRSISIAGNTSNRQNTLKVFNAFKETDFNVAQQRLSSEAGRDAFEVTVEVKK